MPNAESPASAASDLRRLHDALAGPDPLNWVITGDSITHGLVHTQGGRSYAEHLHELIRGELGRTRDAVINTAISGHRITDILGDWDRRVASWTPDVVTLMIGTNDMATGPGQVTAEPAEFAASLREFVTRARSAGTIVVLQTPPSIDIPNAPGRERIIAFADAVREVAASEDVILVDQHARFTELGNGGVPWGMMNDPFHPNAAGHAALALELANALDICPQPGNDRVLPLLEARVAAARL
ncbi:lysophospholipase L1-like esterase [Microbacterium phyllosphaerae]|uniref:Lysophospholipase L1-like esterase n=1 Tax=Microbacterium phyllosphaerae TaxID=124798 RepID=A0ABS4WM04_9MICO|nr:SGNH/GDSL hydrolase family protein [Microbacterium phyllosphaerae]MBP2377232.1 lysophospholipase L1-like esterase [Microbacterium phyllosphaerae]